MRIASILLLAAAPAVASEDAYWEFGDWSVAVTQSFGEEHAYTECRAWTGGDGDPTLSVIAGLIDGEVHEPPHVEVVERAMRGQPTAMVDGSTTAFLFDDGTLFPAAMYTGESEDGPMYRIGHIFVDQDLVTSVLRAMRHGALVHVGISPEWTQTFSLAGFTASFGKIAEQCGFDPSAVI